MSQQTEQKTTLRPLQNGVLVQRVEEESIKGGIILPDTAKKKQAIAKVIAVGKGKTTKEGKTLPMPVKEGDIVLIEQYAGEEVTFQGEDYLIIKSENIIATIN